MVDEKFFNSANVVVYPAVCRSNDYAKSRLISEEMLTNIFGHICENKNFVIDKNNNQIEFMLNGYYFNVDIDNEIIGDDFDGLWVKLNYRTGENTSINELSGDGESGYEGIVYTTDMNTANDDENYFQLLNADSGVPVESKYRFTSNSIQMSINGGDFQ